MQSKNILLFILQDLRATNVHIANGRRYTNEEDLARKRARHVGGFRRPDGVHPEQVSGGSLHAHRRYQGGGHR